MRKLFLIVLMLATACASAPFGASAPAATNPNIQPTLPPAQGPNASSGSLWMKVLSPKNGDTVTTPTVTVIGQAPVETVVTVNDEIILVSQDQTFKQEVTLQKGSNLIQVLASDTSGNEVYVPITVVYKP